MRITERDCRDGVRLDVVGPLHAGLPQRLFRQAVVRVVRAGYRRIVVDARAMPSIDAAGIGALVEAVTTTQPLGIVLVFAELAPRVRRLLALTGLLAILPIAESVDDAVPTPF